MAMKKKLLKEVNWSTIMPLIPVATTEANGLMSKVDKQNIPVSILTNDYPIVRIHNHSSNWERHVSMWWGSFEEVPVCLCIGSYRTDSGLKVTARWITGKYNSIKIYTKNNEVYLYVNNDISSPNQLMGISSSKIQQISRGSSPDDSYTEVITT